MSSSNLGRKRTAAVIQAMKQLNYDPLKELIEVAKTTIDEEIKVDVAKTLMRYCYPQLKHVEIEAQVNHGITVQVQQFLKPTNIVDLEKKDDPALTGGSGFTRIPSESGFADGEYDPRIAGLPVGAGGHPDIIPDP